MLQANGIERDFLNDDSVYIFDMYNRSIYPQDGYAKSMLDLGLLVSSFLSFSALLLCCVLSKRNATVMINVYCAFYFRNKKTDLNFFILLAFLLINCKKLEFIT